MAEAAAVRGGRVELTDELLDYLGDRFVFYQVRKVLGITFGDFVTNPEYYVRKTCELARAILDPGYRPRFVSWDGCLGALSNVTEGGHA
jgi:hypothetical protein